MELGTMSIFMSELIAIERGRNEAFRNFSNIQLYKHLKYLENYDGFDTYFRETYDSKKNPWESIIIETKLDIYESKWKTYIFFADQKIEPPFYTYKEETNNDNIN